MNIQLTVVALHPLGSKYRKIFWHRILRTRAKKSIYSFSMLSSISIFYEYSKDKTRVWGKNVHGTVNAKKKEKESDLPLSI